MSSVLENQCCQILINRNRFSRFIVTYTKIDDEWGEVKT